MTKKLLAALVCLFMMITLLPATTLALENISGTGLDLTTPPAVVTAYTAGSGTVTWDPTVSPATLTFEDVTIVSSSVVKPVISVPAVSGGVNVVFKGTNLIEDMNDQIATLIKCYGETTIILSAGSDTTLKAENEDCFFASGIFFDNTILSHILTITGSGKLNVNTVDNLNGYAIDIRNRQGSHVALSGGTLAFSGRMAGDITLGGVTIPEGSVMDLSGVESCTKGDTGAVINGELHFKDDTTLENINDLDLTGSGTVTTNGTRYIRIDGEWITCVDEDFHDGLDLIPAPTAKTAYTNILKPGSGVVVWDPVMSGGSVCGGTLTLDSAQIQLASIYNTDRFFALPDVPVKIELKGTSTLSTSDGDTGTVLNDADFFLATNSVELTGSGFIDSITARCFISTDGTVTLSGTFSGEIKAGSAVLNDVTISEDRTLNLKDVLGQVTATNTVNNGTLVMKRKADTNADIAAIKALGLTGSGIVKMSDSMSNYYTNSGTVISTIGGCMDFTLSPDAGGNWTYDATLEDNGYEFTGDSTTGYTLKLGNLIIDSYDIQASITLPYDGPVNVILADGATTRINNYGGGVVMLFGNIGNTYPCTITGNGKLVLNGNGGCLIQVSRPLTIAGGDIIIKNVFHSTMGITADGTELTIIGGRLSITATASAIRADKLTLTNMKITSPEGAAFNSTAKTICDANGNAVAGVTIEPIIVSSVMVNPASVSIQKGGTQTFSATVTGENEPAQTVTWSVEGGAVGTTIDANGLLTVAANETATALTVKATSTVDTAKSGTAAVTVTTPAPIEYEITKGAAAEWTKGSTNDLGFTADVDYDKFTGVSVDGADISSDDYTSESGSTIITLKASYLQTLSNGQHTLRVNFTDGYAETSFTVNDASDNPATGDNSQPWLWLGIAAVAVAGLATNLLLAQRKRQRV